MSRMSTADLISNPAMLRCVPAAVRKELGAKTIPEAQHDYNARSEKELQRHCTDWLVLHGYLNCTAANAVSPPATFSGWFAHQPRSEKQPFAPDLVLFNPAMTRCLCVELKKPGTAAPSFQPGQREMVSSDRWLLARSLDAFRAIAQNWETLENLLT